MRAAARTWARLVPSDIRAATRAGKRWPWPASPEACAPRHATAPDRGRRDVDATSTRPSRRSTYDYERGDDVDEGGGAPRGAGSELLSGDGTRLAPSRRYYRQIS